MSVGEMTEQIFKRPASITEVFRYIVSLGIDTGL